MFKIFTLCTFLFTLCSHAGVWRVRDNLQEAFTRAGNGDTVFVYAGTYTATPASFIEETCGNCQQHQTQVSATRGFLIEGKQLRIIGDPSGEVKWVTRAGYGVLFYNSRGSVMENITITGGIRDDDGAATDAGVVLKYSTVKLLNCTIRDNTDFVDSTIVGIGGVMLRENSDAWIVKCSIINNSWDGIALYRGGQAWITDCVIDSGRGAGIGVTWDATAICQRNTVSNYWKGIGSFGTATVIARNNLIHDNLGWGLIASGESTMIAENNTVVQNGNCGIAIWNAGCRGRMVNNISAMNGWRKEWVCPCVGFWNQEQDTAGWVISNNLVWNNVTDDVLNQDSTDFMFADPKLADTLSFKLSDTSPALHAGDSTLTNSDGTLSTIGYTGGPGAKR